MIVYHVTDAEAAAAIDTNGFEDQTGAYLTDQEWTGVWVADRPLDCNEGVDGDTVFEITLEPESIADFEWIEEGRGYREWFVPAEILNRFPRSWLRQ